MDVDVISSLASGTGKAWNWEKERIIKVHEKVVCSAVETSFGETALLTSHHGKAMASMADTARHGPRECWHMKGQRR